MIELIRTEACTECDAVEATLSELGLDYTVTTAKGADDDVPLLRHGDQTIGREEIKRYLAELAHPVDEWTRFKADIEFSNGTA